MQAAELDSVALSVRCSNRNYIENMSEIQLKTGVIIEPIYQKSETPTPEAIAKMLRLGKRINKRALFVGIMHTVRGLMYPVSYYKHGRGVIVEFNGLTQYRKKEFVLTEASELMRQDLKDFVSSGLDFELHAVDVCIDSQRAVKSILKAIARKRKPNDDEYETTIYYETSSQPKGKANDYLQIYNYDKQAKNKLAYPLNRVEFAFKSAALKCSNSFDDDIGRAAAKVARWAGKKAVKISAFWR